MREGRHRWHPRPYLALPHAAGPYLATPDLVAGAAYTAVLTPSSIPRPCRLAIPFLLDRGHKRLVLAGEDPGGDIGRAEGRVDGKIAAGFHRFRAIEAAVDRAGNARLCDVESVIGAVQRQFDGGGPCAETFPVEIADRQRAGLRAEIVGPVKAAGRGITGAIVEHRADRVAGIGSRRRLARQGTEVTDRGRHPHDPKGDRPVVDRGNKVVARIAGQPIAATIAPLQVLTLAERHPAPQQRGWERRGWRIDEMELARLRWVAAYHQLLAVDLLGGIVVRERAPRVSNDRRRCRGGRGLGRSALQRRGNGRRPRGGIGRVRLRGGRGRLALRRLLHALGEVAGDCLRDGAVGDG